MKHFLLVLLPFAAFAQAKVGASQTPENLVQYAHPLVGTAKMGHTYPGATVPFGAVQIGDGGDRTHADADALVIGQRHDSGETTMIFSREHGYGRTKVHGNALPGCEVTAGCDGQLAV